MLARALNPGTRRALATRFSPIDTLLRTRELPSRGIQSSPIVLVGSSGTTRKKEEYVLLAAAARTQPPGLSGTRQFTTQGAHNLKTGWSSYPPGFLDSVKRPSHGVPLPPPGRPPIKFSFRNGFFYAGLVIVVLAIILIRRGNSVRKKQQKSNKAYLKSLEKKVGFSAFENVNNGKLSVSCGKPVTTLTGYLEPQPLFKWLENTPIEGPTQQQDSSATSSEEKRKAYTLKIKFSSMRDPVKQVYQLVEQSLSTGGSYGLFLSPAVLRKIISENNDSVLTIPETGISSSTDGNSEQHAYDFVAISDSKESLDRLQSVLGYWACEKLQVEENTVDCNNQFLKQKEENKSSSGYSLSLLHPGGCSFASLLNEDAAAFNFDRKNGCVRIANIRNGNKGENTGSLIISDGRERLGTADGRALDWYFGPSHGQLKTLVKGESEL